jgi:nitrite reductase/ring-hydroxylating ferredoxin subunit
MSERDSSWIRIPVPLPDAAQTTPFQAGKLELLLCNVDGAPFVIRDRCPHARTSLAGEALRGTVLEWPLHGGQLDVRDGSPVAMPIRRAVACYPVRSNRGRLQVALPATLS